MRIAYIDCSAGAAGDMLLAALVDAGASRDGIEQALASLDVEGWKLSFEEVTRHGLRALRANVETSEAAPRQYQDIVALIEGAHLDEQIAALALEAFEVLARAEGRVHGIDPARVHFHEVGALDAIVDIVGCCAALASLHLERVVVSPIATGTGTVSSGHGELPLPAPAVTEILRDTGASVYGRSRQELITPTGAALLVALASDFADMPPLHIEAVGTGAGSADLEFPNVLRVIVGVSAAEPTRPENEVLVETNIDDMSPELFPHVIAKLIEAGAQDAWVTPIVMKKGRPAFTVSVLCARDLEEGVVDILFRETTTLGTRITSVSKRAVAREWVDTKVAGATVRVKVGRYDGAIATLAPEHDDAVAAAAATGLPLKQVYADASQEAKRALAGH